MIRKVERSLGVCFEGSKMMMGGRMTLGQIVENIMSTFISVRNLGYIWPCYKLKRLIK